MTGGIAMRARLRAGGVIDGFTLGERIHKGGTAVIYRVVASETHPDPGFPMVLKAPLLSFDDSAVGIIGLEMEQIVLARLLGPHVPRFVAAGDVRASPYVVMEWIDGYNLGSMVAAAEKAPLAADAVALIGAECADAIHSIHQQDVIHFDIKAENVLIRSAGQAVLIDFGFARHARYPDLLAEEREFAAGSAVYVSPEQVEDNRTDPRSDLFALGVLLYELATGTQPFGNPQTFAGMRDRLWRPPLPPRAVNGDVPPWLQQVILRCLEPAAEDRYQSAAHIAFDLRHPDQVVLSKLADRSEGLSVAAQARRWWRSRQRGAPLTALSQPRTRVPVLMVAVDTEHPDDDRHPALQAATRQQVSLYPELRLMCLSVVRAVVQGDDASAASQVGRHLEHKLRLKRWIEPLGISPSRVSMHVVEATDPAGTVLDLAHSNHVDLIIIGAPGASSRALAWWRSVASGVTASARCSVHVVRVPEA